MITFGKHITEKNDTLSKIDIEYLFKLVREPSNELKSQIEQLRTILTIDVKKYRILKTKLPYVCCGIFNPQIRRTENFASISNFIIDIDHIKEKGLSIEVLKQKLITDERVKLLFVSPGNDGLKVFFLLENKCYDRAKFSLFYKLFAKSFSEQYNLNQVVDRRTSDVTRACFLSTDPDAYFNNNPDTIKMESFINFENYIEVTEAEKLFKHQKKEFHQTDTEIPVKKELSPDILQQIKIKLNPNIKTKIEKQIYVPDKLNKIIDSVKQKVAEFNIETVEITNIHYGKKFRFQLQNMWAEINVFYGKKGYSVVKTPKRGSNTELTEIVNQLLCELFYN